MDAKAKMKFNILVVFAIIIFSAAITPIALQNDTFYTIKIGEHIMQNGIDMTDPFSWHQDLSYTYPHWLYDVGMYLIYQLGGWTGIYVSTIVLTCLLGCAIYFTNNKLTKNPLTSFILTIGVMYLAKNFIAARAQLPTFILFVMTIFFIEMFLKTKKKRYAAGLIIIPLLIANLHVAVWPFYFVLFVPYIAEYLLCVLVDANLLLNSKIAFLKLRLKLNKKKRSADKEELLMKAIETNREKKIVNAQRREQRRENPYKIRIHKNKNVKYLILIMLIAALTGLCTPIGDTPYTYLEKTMQGNTTQNINEHLPLTLINQKDVLCLITALIAILMLTDIKIKLSDLFLIGGLIVLSLMSRRQISMFFIIGVFVLNRLICAFLEKYDRKRC